MFNFISNIPIARRLLIAFLLAALVPGVIIGILGLTFFNTQTNRTQAIEASVTAFKAATEAKAYLQNTNDLITLAYLNEALSKNKNNNGVAANLTSDNLRSLRIAQGQFSIALEDFQDNHLVISSPQMSDVRATLDANSLLPNYQQSNLQITQLLWKNYEPAVDQLVQSIQQNAPQKQIDQQAQDLSNKYSGIVQAWDDLTTNTQDMNIKVVQSADTQNQPLIIGLAIAILVITLVIAVIGYVTYLSITRPLQQLSTLTKRIARGETHARVNITGRDEIYLVATSMNSMLDNIVRLIQETQSQRDVLQAQVEKLVSEVSGVGEGDLRVQAEVTADALGVLADSFNYMVEELGSLVVRVKMVANEVENSTNMTLDRMTQLVETGDVQIKQIAQAVGEVEHMTTSSRQVAERSQSLYEVARTARQDAHIGRESVTQAIEGMGRINENVQGTATKVQVLGERSREINDIVEAMSSIAHQTNRLALDAAIQAAMAGENGKGFGAVAADIRRLAERAKEQAGVITRIVRSVRDDIGAVAISMQDTERETAAGTRLTQEAGVALRSIFSAVEHQAREVENINQVAMKQLQSSSAVLQIMNAVSDSTQQGSISTRDASQNMERLARLVEQLRASVEAFKLRDGQDYFAPNGTNVSMENEQENLTVSGLFRTVTSTAQSAQIFHPGGHSRSLLAPPAEDAFSFAPANPWQQGAPATPGSWSSDPTPNPWQQNSPAAQNPSWQSDPTPNPWQQQNAPAAHNPWQQGAPATPNPWQSDPTPNPWPQGAPVVQNPWPSDPAVNAWQQGAPATPNPWQPEPERNGARERSGLLQSEEQWRRQNQQINHNGNNW